jgi:hypothetical protein
MPYSRSASSELPSLAAWAPNGRLRRATLLPTEPPGQSRQLGQSWGRSVAAGSLEGAQPLQSGPPGDWCIGNTVVSKTATPGSIPGSPARLQDAKSRIAASSDAHKPANGQRSSRAGRPLTCLARSSSFLAAFSGTAVSATSCRGIPLATARTAPSLSGSARPRSSSACRANGSVFDHVKIRPKE